GLVRDRDRTLEIIRDLELCDEKTARVQLMMAERKINSVVSTSAGRLFDGVSALLGIRKASTFEGEAATALQFAAEEYAKKAENNCMPVPARIPAEEDEGTLILQTDLLFEDLLKRRLAGEDPEKLSWIFHKYLADMITEACILIGQRTGLDTCALSGGVFQNTLLLGMVQGGLEKEGFRVLIHSLVPPNDGGIALGQAAAGLYRKSKGLLNL
ncbi:MAG: carbamoyltransferase HypF, partial [Lachnospiraceae bacterium]|nr:carbamoyltransferase HypF [Lachnospiraceae bacterium]